MMTCFSLELQIFHYRSLINEIEDCKHVMVELSHLILIKRFRI